MTKLKSYRFINTTKKEKNKKVKQKKKSDFMKKPLSSGIKLGFGFMALGLGMSAMDRV